MSPTSDPTSVGVVIPYFDGRDRLRSVLHAFDAQTRRPAHVVIADDGSSIAPDVTGFDGVTVVRQTDLGVRPAAARNLGAGALGPEVGTIVFCDGDTVPDPEYVDRLTESLRDGSADVSVGRRRYADLTGLESPAVSAWVRRPTDDRLLSDVAWLDDGYRRTDGLTDGSHGIFRYVISAVLATTRAMFDVVGGFDGSIDRYGGEDWEFAFRCWVAGARFRHVPAAIAYHDGPDFGARSADPDVKANETATLARSIGDPSARGPGLIRARTDGVVDLRVSGRLAAELSCIQSLLAGTWSDVTIGLVGDTDVVESLLRFTSPDPRVRRGPVGTQRSCRWWSTLDSPVVVDRVTVEAVVRDVAEARIARRTVRTDTATWVVTSARMANLVVRRRGDGVVERLDDAALACVGPCERVDGVALGMRPDPMVDLEAWYREQSRPAARRLTDDVPRR